MKVRVLYFAGARDLIGISEEERTLPAEVKTVEDFARWLPEVHPVLADRMGHVRIARNEAFADSSEPLTEGDVLALIPPVAGG